MVEIRVAVADAAGAHGLLRRLAALFDRSSVSFDGTAQRGPRSLGVGVTVGRPGHRRGRVVARGGRHRFGQAVGRRSLLHDARAGGPRSAERTSGVTALVPQLIALTYGMAPIPPVAKDLLDTEGPFGRVQLERPAQTPNEGKAWAVALQLQEAARPVPAERRTPQALPRLRRRTPQRPDRGREPEACAPFGGLRWSWQNLAAAMIETPRSHGHFDQRWHTNGLSSRDREDDARIAGSARQRHALRRAVAR